MTQENELLNQFGEQEHGHPDDCIPAGQGIAAVHAADVNAERAGHDVSSGTPQNQRLFTAVLDRSLAAIS